MPDLLTRETALSRVPAWERQEPMATLLLLAQAEALEWAAETQVRPAAAALDDEAYTKRDLHSPEASVVMDAITEMYKEAARLRREAKDA